MRPRRSLLLLVLTLAGCKEKAVADGTPAPAADTSLANAAVDVLAPDRSYTLKLPSRWRGVIRTDTLSTAERGAARPGAMNIVYLPRDTAVIPQTLAVFTVYDSVAWAKVKAAGGPPPGDSLTSRAGLVYVLSLPQSNPFAPGSVDALKFDSLSLKPTDMTTLLQLPPG